MRFTKYIILLYICVMLCSLVTSDASAAKQTSGKDLNGIRWNYDTTTRTLTFSGKGPCAGYYYTIEDGYGGMPWASWDMVCLKVVFEEGITEVGSGYLTGFNKVNDISLPDSLTIIREHAFEDCTSLKSIKFPDNLKEIEKSAFSYCSLKEIDLPESVKVIGDSAFYYNKLKTIEWKNGIQYGSMVFGNNRKATRVVLSDEMDELPQGFISACKNIKSYTIPQKFTKIPEHAFSFIKMEQFEIPSTVKTIKKQAFYDAKIGKLIIHEGVKEIGTMAFTGLKTEELILPDSVTEMKKNTLEGCMAKKIVLPSGLKKMRRFMLENCLKLESIVIPENVTSIDYCAFSRCYSLQTVVIQSKKLTKVDGMAFVSEDKKKGEYPLAICVPKDCLESYQELFEDVILPKGSQVLPLNEDGSLPEEAVAMQARNYSAKVNKATDSNVASGSGVASKTNVDTDDSNKENTSNNNMATKVAALIAFLTCVSAGVAVDVRRRKRKKDHI